jgi:Holliday junction resolvase RusA-like endonuclease
MSEIKLVIYGEPVPQGRPRFARIGKYVHAYDPEKSKNYKQLVRFWVTQHLKKIDSFKPLENALYVDITFWLSIPSSWSKKKRIEADSGIIRPISKKGGDIDNLCKCVIDAMLGIVFVDDSQIIKLGASKNYSETPRCEVTIISVDK